MNVTSGTDIFGSQRVAPYRTWAPQSRHESHLAQLEARSDNGSVHGGTPCRGGPFISEPDYGAIRHPPIMQQSSRPKEVKEVTGPKYVPPPPQYGGGLYMAQPGNNGVQMPYGVPVEAGIPVGDGGAFRGVVVQSESGAAGVMTLFQMLASLMGFVAGVMAMTLGAFHLFKSYATLTWPHKFLDDVNSESWRMSVFSLVPSVLIDIWTPFIFGAITSLVHVKDVKLSPIGCITKNYLIYGVWLIFQALWGNMGYRGGLGISIGIFSLLAAALSLLVGLLGGDAEASILFDYKAYTNSKKIVQNDDPRSHIEPLA